MSRIEKVNSLLQNELSQIFLEVLGKTGSLITITAVECTPDLSSAKVWVSILGEQNHTLQFIKDNLYFLQQKLNKRLHIKKNPRLVIKLDRSAENVERINEILS